MTRTRQTRPTLVDRLMLEANRFKDEAHALPYGPLRDAMIRKAGQTEIAAHIDQWLSSPGLRAPV